MGTTKQSALSTAVGRISYRQLDHWVRRGWLGEGLLTGTGKARHLSAQQLRRARILATAADAGISVARVSAALDAGDWYGRGELLTLELAAGVHVTIVVPGNAAADDSPVRVIQDGPAAAET